MGIRAGGDPLTSVVPELDRLAGNPREYLSEGPLLFGPRRFFGLAAIFAVPGLAFLILWQIEPAERERLAMGVACLLGAGYWLFHSLTAAGHSIFLGANGVEVRYLDTTVYCPWDLFDVNAEAWSGGKDNPSAGIALPIAADVVPLVVLRRGVVELARGLNVRAPQAFFVSASELILPGRYELNSEDLGKLIQLLAARLSGRLSKRTLEQQAEAGAYAARDRATAEPLPSPRTSGTPVNAADEEGFYAVSLARFRLPACCVVCAGEPETTVMLSLEFGRLALEAPVCQRCRDAEAASNNRAIAGWSAGLALLFAVCGVLAPAEARGSAMLVGALVGAILGLVVGTYAGGPKPVEVRDHNPSTGTLRIRFRNEEVERKFREMQARS